MKEYYCIVCSQQIFTLRPNNTEECQECYNAIAKGNWNFIKKQWKKEKAV